MTKLGARHAKRAKLNAATTATTPELGRVGKPQLLLSQHRRQYGGIPPERISMILRKLDQGDLEEWSDLADHILKYDAHVHSIYQTRLQAVASAPYTIEPNRITGDEAIASRAALFCHQALERIRGINDLFVHLLDARGRGWAVSENVYVRDGGCWLIDPEPVASRRFRLAQDWTLRLWDGGLRGGEGTPLEADKWIVLSSGTVPEHIVDSGELLSCVWPWFLKAWGWRFWSIAAERFGNPLAVGTYPANATDEVRQALIDGLESMSGDHSVVKEQGTEIEILEPQAAISSEVWRDLVGACDAAMTKAILGATDLTEPGDNGSKAAVQTRNEVRVERAASDARLLAQAIEHGLFEPLLKYNTHLFGGRIPPTPRLAFTFAEKKPGAIFGYHMQGGIVRKNDVRAQLDLPPLRPEEGGEDLLDVRDVPTAAAPAPAAKPISRDDLEKTDVPQDEAKQEHRA